jgi:hypothetical protein
MAFTFAITVGGAERVVTIDPDDLPLSFFEDIEEAQATGKFTPIIKAYGAAFGLTDAERRSLTVRQFKALAEGIKEATNVPLASA